ncbi:hypothetical protein [Lactobacillus sp. PSON]|uniref:hypothetical protein n=1 Tax=Lactobacillus sp. PSON TaxID=3455454 RepID=UPI004040F6C4
MAEDSINVEFQASDARSVKMLNQLYNYHLVLNDIAVRLNEQIGNSEEITVPNEEDVKNLNDIFSKSVGTFTDITSSYENVDKYIENFYGNTKDFAQALVEELVRYNNGIADIADVGLDEYDEEKLNKWVNSMMEAVINTNETFNKLIGKN